MFYCRQTYAVQNAPSVEHTKHLVHYIKTLTSPPKCIPKTVKLTPEMNPQHLYP